MRGVAVWVMLLLLVPLADASGDALVLSSAEAVHVQGPVRIEVPGGTGFVRGRDATLDVVLRNVTGELTLSTQESTRTPLTQTPRDETRHEVLRLQDATLTLRARNELVSVGARSPEGLLAVEGAVDAAGLPMRVERDTPAGVAFPTPVLAAPERLDLTWRRGWLAFGTTTPDQLPLESFPPLDAGALRLAGAHRALLFGGNLTIVDVDGEPREVRLGTWETQGPVPGSPAAWTVVWRQAMLDAVVADGRVPLAADWGLAGPDATWRVDGTLRWTGATGHATLAGQTRAFESAAVTLDAAGAFVMSPPAVDAAAPVEHRGEGDFRALRIDGATLAAPPPRGLAAPAASLTAGALVLLALTNAGQALLAAGAASLYTRLGPGDVLRHPQRRHIHDVVTNAPGIHQRELHRRVGGAWGPFAFHLRMLAKGGHVRILRQGGYTLVFPAGPLPAPAAAIPHPVARAVYDAVPPDGSAIALTDLVARVGVSRELVGYHLRGLEARGLVKRVPLAGARRGVARLPEAEAA